MGKQANKLLVTAVRLSLQINHFVRYPEYIVDTRDNVPIPPTGYASQGGSPQLPVQSQDAFQNTSQAIPQAPVAPTPQVPVSPMPRASSASAPQAPITSLSQAPIPPKKQGRAAKVGIGIGIAVAALLALGIFWFSSMFSSCAAVLTDAPPNESKETAAFIHDTAVTSRDLETFDALRGCFESMYYEHLTLLTMEEEQRGADEAKAVVDAYRAQLEKESWPRTHSLFQTGDRYSSPQLWVRVAQLAQDYLQKETGESWRIENVSFPYFDVGPIPKIELQHGENSSITTYLVCEDGEDAGLGVEVYYYRWANPAYFANNIEESRARLARQQERFTDIQSSSLIEGRKCALVDHELYIWSQGTDDPLRDIDAFEQFTYKLWNETGKDTFDISLLEVDAPLVITRRYTERHGNRLEPQLVDSSTAQDALLKVHALDVHVAPADMLFSQFRDEAQQGKDAYVSAVSGYLAPEEDDDTTGWRAPQKGSAYDEDLNAFIAEYVGQDKEKIIAFSAYDTSDMASEDLHFNLVLPRGVLPEKPDLVESAVIDLQKALWQRYVNKLGKSDEVSVFLFVYVIDGQHIQGPQGEVDFATLRSVGKENPQSMGDYDVELLLRAYMACFGSNLSSQSDGWESDFGMDLNGEIPDSRAWFLASYGLDGQS